MTGLLSSVRNKVLDSCIVSRCRKNRCNIQLQGPSHDRLIIDCDKRGSPFGPNQTKCDYLLFEETQSGVRRAIPIEMKGGRVDAREVIAQLQAGAREMENLIPSGVNVQFLPVVAYGNVPKGERVALNKGVVRFHNRPEEIRRIRCGSPLPRS